jgi:predicted PurR-regulated permease PerM
MNPRISAYFFFILLLGAVVATVLIFLPFLTPLVLALAGAIVLRPLFRLMLRVFGHGRFGPSLAAIATVVIVAIVILVPLFFLVASVYAEVQLLYGMLIDETNRSHVVTSLNAFSQSMSQAVFGALPAYSFDSFNITEYLKTALEWVFDNLDSIFSSMTKVAGYALVFLLSFYYFLRDGSILKKMFISWSPLLDSNDEYITRVFKRAVRSVFAGTMVVSLLEGVVLGLAFYTFGIPAPALWGTLAAITALIPGFGTSLVVLPAAAYLYISGTPMYAVGMLIWGYAAVTLIDHMLGPVLMNRGIHIHPFLVLLSVLGGLITFGIVGLVLGPVILVVLFTLLELYRTSFTDIRTEQKTNNDSVIH